jgi:hypothetical protein
MFERVAFRSIEPGRRGTILSPACLPINRAGSPGLNTFSCPSFPSHRDKLTTKIRGVVARLPVHVQCRGQINAREFIPHQLPMCDAWARRNEPSLICNTCCCNITTLFTVLDPPCMEKKKMIEERSGPTQCRVVFPLSPSAWF